VDKSGITFDMTPPSPTDPGPTIAIPGTAAFANRRNAAMSFAYEFASYPGGAPPAEGMDGSLKSSAAATMPPIDCVYRRSGRA
jgi:hypothetical protein